MGCLTHQQPIVKHFFQNKRANAKCWASGKVEATLWHQHLIQIQPSRGESIKWAKCLKVCALRWHNFVNISPPPPTPETKWMLSILLLCPYVYGSFCFVKFTFYSCLFRLCCVKCDSVVVGAKWDANIFLASLLLTTNCASQVYFGWKLHM